MNATTSVDDYLRRLARALDSLEETQRAAIVEDVKAHLTDAVDDGRDLAEVLSGLGTPEDVAEESLAQLGVGWGTPVAKPDRAARWLHIASVATAVVTAVFVAFFLPMLLSSVWGGSTPDVVTNESLVAAYGLGPALLALAPAMFAALPLIVSAPVRRPIAWANAVALTILSIISGFEIGMYFVPLALLLWAAALVPTVLDAPPSGRRRLLWRCVGAIAIAAPAALVIVGYLSGSIEIGWPGWLLVAAIALTAVLFGSGFRWAYPLVALAGAAVMILAMITLGLITAAVWIVGGVWLAFGLAGMVTRETRLRASVTR